MMRACAECGTLLGAREGHDLVLGDAPVVLCELCAAPRKPPAEPDPTDVAHVLHLALEATALAAGQMARNAGADGAWPMKVDVARSEARRCLRLLVHAGDARSQGDPVEDGFRILARAARATADALDATADAIHFSRTGSGSRPR